MKWSEFLALPLERRRLNLGASAKHAHPNPHYPGFVAVTVPPEFFQFRVVNLETGAVIDNPDALEHPPDKLPTVAGSVVYHDLRATFPLPDNSVDRVHSEDCFEHLEEEDAVRLLCEVYRVLKPGGTLRVGVPDYRNPKDAFCLDRGFDPRNKYHVTLTTKPVLDRWVQRTPFVATFYHYWNDAGEFVRKAIDYSTGWVQRTPDNDARNTAANPLHVTSLVVDLVKPVAEKEEN